eukprot:SAG22_NODE_892_length_6646_cov_21.438369_5_plen_100_part_00
MKSTVLLHTIGGQPIGPPKTSLTAATADRPDLPDQELFDEDEGAAGVHAKRPRDPAFVSACLSAEGDAPPAPRHRGGGGPARPRATPAALSLERALSEH